MRLSKIEEIDIEIECRLEKAKGISDMIRAIP